MNLRKKEEKNKIFIIIFSMKKEIDSKILTSLAFIIGFILIDDLNTREQNALGNWFMLLGQTLCTNSAEVFRKNYSTYVNNESDKEFSLRLMNKIKESIEKGISNI